MKTLILAAALLGTYIGYHSKPHSTWLIAAVLLSLLIPTALSIERIVSRLRK